MRVLLALVCYLGTMALGFAQAPDSITLSGRRASAIRVDSQVIRTDTIKDITDSLKKKSFFAAKADKIKSWSSPKKAVMMSLVLPGSGQIYNRKGVWWKLPLCYGGYTAAIVVHINNRRNYFYIRDLYELRVKQLPIPTEIRGRNVPQKYLNSSITELFNEKNRYRNPYERSYLYLGAAHVYCIADAFVTAHLNAFDLTEDLSLKIKPQFDWVAQKPMLGLSLQF